MFAAVPKRPLKLPPPPLGYIPPQYILPDADDIEAAQEDVWRAETRREFDLRLFSFMRRFPDIPPKEAEAVEKQWWRVQKEALRLDAEYRNEHPNG